MFVFFSKRKKILKYVIICTILPIILINYEFKNNHQINNNYIKINLDNYKIQENIYFVIFDGMTSLKYAEKYFDVQEEKEIEKLNLLGLRYLKRSFSSYNQTPLTMASIIYGGYHLKSESPKYYNMENLYPEIIYKYKKKNNLILNLKKMTLNSNTS